MKKLTLLFAILCIAFVSCKKDDVKPIVVKPDCCDNMKEIGTVYVEVHLLDYIITNLGTNFDTPNNNHFSSHVYALSKSKGVTLDSIELNLFGNYLDTIQLVNTTLFSYCCLLPNQIDSLKINKFNETTLEIWDSSTKIGSAKVGSYGFYGRASDYDTRVFTTIDPILTDRIFVRI